MAATPIDNNRVATKAPSNLASVLSLRNSPYGIRSTLTCIANITSENAIAVAPMNAPPVVRSKVRNLSRLSLVANWDSISLG